MKRLTLRALPAAALAAGLLGCAHPGPVVRRVEMEPIEFQVRPGGQVEMVDPADLFERATAAFNDKRFPEAAEAFDRVVREFPESRYAVPSYYNAGLALEGAGDLRGAAERYRRLASERRDRHEALDGLYRLGGVLAELKDWRGVETAFTEALARKDLTLGDRVEGMARRAVAQYEQHALPAAERSIRELQDYYKAHELEERLESDFFLGMAAYYLGEIAHAQYRALPIRLPEKQLQQDLDAKARLLLVVQQRYVETMRVNNPSWATAAGFQIGSLYREFYDDLVGAPVPPQLTGEAREVYQEEVRRQVRPLLMKAISFHEKNVVMAERIGESNEWVKRSNDQMEQLRQLLAPGPQSQPSPPPPSPAPPLPKPRDPVRSPTVL